MKLVHQIINIITALLHAVCFVIFIILNYSNYERGIQAGWWEEKQTPQKSISPDLVGGGNARKGGSSKDKNKNDADYKRSSLPFERFSTAELFWRRLWEKNNDNCSHKAAITIQIHIQI